MRLGFILLGLLAAPMAARAQPALARPLTDVLAHLGDKVSHSEAYRPNGIDIRRGMVLDLNADLIGGAICRAQRLMVF